MLLMIFVVALYSITSLNDKYAVSKCKYTGSQLTFLMAAGTVFFLLFTLPFSDLYFTLSPMSFLSVGLIALSKYLEFGMSAKILVEMSVFELKAWLGLTLFISYFADVFLYGQGISVLELLCIFVTAAGLVLIAREGRKQVDYKKIALPLVLYLSSRLIYGFTMKAAEPYISSTMTLFFALIVLALIMLPAAKPLTIPKESPEGLKGMMIVIGCKLPNAVGLLCENRIAAESLTNFSFIQPMILIVMFVSGFFSQKEKPSKLSVAGGLCVIAGIFGFQAAVLI
ncbi:MAG: hypothetical protein ACI4RH_01310 [Huintestinicola sp.]